MDFIDKWQHLDFTGDRVTCKKRHNIPDFAQALQCSEDLTAVKITVHALDAKIILGCVVMSARKGTIS